MSLVDIVCVCVCDSSNMVRSTSSFEQSGREELVSWARHPRHEEDGLVTINLPRLRQLRT